MFPQLGKTLKQNTNIYLYMGQLNNLYVSSSYQGLLKLADSTSGVTGTLQTVQDGSGNNLPIKISSGSVQITGSLIGTASYATQALSASWAPDSTDTGSLVTTSSFNAYTSSVNTKLAGLDVATGSLQNQINQKLDTGSFNTYTSSNDSKVNSLIASTGSYATTSSLTSLSQSIALTDLNQNNVIAGLATTSSLTNLSSSIATTDLSQNNRLTSIEGITGSLATTSSLTSLSQSIATTDLGQNNRLGSLETATGSLQNQINQKLDTGSFNSYTSSQALYDIFLVDLIATKVDTGSFNSYTSSNDGKVNSLINATGSYATTGSNNFVGQQNINSSVNITGSLNVTGEITALSASITYLETIYQTSSVIFSSGSNILGDEAVDTQTLNGQVNIPLGNLNITGSTTSSLGFFGNLQGTASFATNALSASNSVNSDSSISSSFAQTAISSSQSQNAVSASQAQNAVSSSYANNSTSSSYSNNSTSSSYASNATSASFSQNTISGSFSNFAVSSSFAQTASFASNGGVTQLIAGPNVIISPLSGKGQVTVSSTGTGTGSFNTATGSYGSFYDTTTQINPVANTPNSMSFNETAITNGVAISGSISPFNTYIKTENAGIYNLQFSAQVDKIDSGTDSLDIWIRKNGTDLLDTATTVTLTGNNDKSVAAWNWFVQSAANDYYQIIWASADTDMRLLAEVSSSVHPGIPSVIATANRIDQFLSNTGSFNGDFNGSFTGSLQGTASFATNALSASYAPQDPLPSGLVSGSAQISYTGITDVPSGIISGSVQISDLGFATTSSVNQKLDTGSFNTYSGDTLNLINQKLDSGSFNSYTSSNDSKVNSLISQTGSYVTELESGSFLTTGSVSNNTLTFTKGDGSSFNLVVNTGSLPSGLVSGSAQIVELGFAQTSSLSSYVLVSQTGSMSVATASYVLEAVSASYATNALTASFALNAVATDTGSLMKTGSVSSNVLTFTKGDGSTFNLTVATGSGGSAFPFSGSAVITGSLLVSGSATITGSVQGNVNALSISSNTASLNLNNGNFFTLQLVSGSATHINPSNIKPGQTINILLSTTGSGTVNFPSSVKQISGSAYVPTTTTSKDIITLISFDSSSLFLANVKNLI